MRIDDLNLKTEFVSATVEHVLCICGLLILGPRQAFIVDLQADMALKGGIKPCPELSPFWDIEGESQASPAQQAKQYHGKNGRTIWVLQCAMEIDLEVLFSLREMRASKVVQSNAKLHRALLKNSEGRLSGAANKDSQYFAYDLTDHDCRQPPGNGLIAVTLQEKQIDPNGPDHTSSTEVSVLKKRRLDKECWQPHQNSAAEITHHQSLQRVKTLSRPPYLRWYDTVTQLKLGTSYSKRLSRYDPPEYLPPVLHSRISKAQHAFEGDRGSLYPRVACLRSLSVSKPLLSEPTLSTGPVTSDGEELMEEEMNGPGSYHIPRREADAVLRYL